MSEILPEGKKSPVKEDLPTLKTGEAETAATLEKQKSEPKSPVKAPVKTPVKKEDKMTPKKEVPVEVEVKYEEEEKPKSAEASDHLVIFATEGKFLEPFRNLNVKLLIILGEAVIKDVEKLGENVPLKPEKEEERIEDFSVDELEVEDSIMEQVNGEVEEVTGRKKSNGVEHDLMEIKSAALKVVPKESEPYSDKADASESLKSESRKENDSLNCIQEKES